MIFAASLCCKILFYLLLGGVSAESIIATVGTDVTLVCNYDAQHYGRLSVCWGRGAIPNSGCAREVIRSDGTSVISRLSERYVLRGNLAEGDVSLTIMQLEESDSGMYGCRVEIPGWFNDHKHQMTLTVVAVRPSPLTVAIREVKERSVTVGWAPAFDGGKPITSYAIEIKNKHSTWATADRTEVTNPNLTQLTLVDLRPAKAYNLRMFAANSVGLSDSSNILTVTTKEAAPAGPPLDVQVEALTSSSIRVTWKPPGPEFRNGMLRSYAIGYREYNPVVRHFGMWHHLSVTARREEENVILRNLKPSTKYSVTIQALTNAGIGPAATAPLCSTLDEVHSATTALTTKSTSSPTTVETNITPGLTPDLTPGLTTGLATGLTTVHTTSTAMPAPSATVWEESSTTITGVPPDAPVLELKEVKGSMISLAWTPGYEGDSLVTGYYLESKAVNASWDFIKTVVDFSANQTEATIIEMNPSTYNIRMFAKNSVGTSKASNILTITTKTEHHTDDLPTTISTVSQAAVSVEASQNAHLAAVLVPVALVLLIAAILVAWKLRQMKQKKGSIDVWMTGGMQRLRGSESLQEL